MNDVVLVVLLVASLGLLALVLNQVQARLALLEVTLNEGLPPGHAVAAPRTLTGENPAVDAATALGSGTHVFLSRSCHACQRLLAELGERPVDLEGLRLRFVDRARPLAADVADANRAALDEDQDGVARSVGANPLPYTTVVGEHGLVVGAVTPTRADVLAACRQAGVRARSRA